MPAPIILLGAGGHARVLLASLREAGREIIGYCNPTVETGDFSSLKYLGPDSTLQQADRNSAELVNGLGSTGDLGLRRAIFLRFSDLGFRFASVIHPTAWLDRSASLGEGCQIMARAVVQVGCQLGENVLVNTAASIDHDCQIGAHCHLAPGAILSGSVRLGEGVHVGTAATIIQGVMIGEKAVIGAGSVVLRNAPPYSTCAGIPARQIKSGPPT